MIIKLKPELKAVLDRTTRSGTSPEEVLDQAFAVIREQHQDLDWMAAERDAISAQIAEGLAQAERGELLAPEEVIKMLLDRRAKRMIA